MDELQNIQNLIYEVRGVRVMLDKDLADLYQVTTGNLNKAWCLEFDFENIDVDFGKLSSNRFSGRCIRAVK